MVEALLEPLAAPVEAGQPLAVPCLAEQLLQLAVPLCPWAVPAEMQALQAGHEQLDLGLEFQCLLGKLGHHLPQAAQEELPLQAPGWALQGPQTGCPGWPSPLLRMPAAAAQSSPAPAPCLQTPIGSLGICLLHLERSTPKSDRYSLHQIPFWVFL